VQHESARADGHNAGGEEAPRGIVFLDEIEKAFAGTCSDSLAKNLREDYQEFNEVQGGTKLQPASTKQIVERRIGPVR
jgi:hypothetical protein